MITKLEIVDDKNTPLSYLYNLKLPSKEFEFKEGLNLIIGRNGSGKTSLLNLIRNYTLCFSGQCSSFPSDALKISNNLMNQSFSFSKVKKPTMKNGVRIFSDYKKAVLNFRTPDMIANHEWCDNETNFFQSLISSQASAGQGQIGALNSLIKHIKNIDSIPDFPHDQIENKKQKVNEVWEEYYNVLQNYYKENTVETSNQITILMDEPDKGLDIENLIGLKKFLLSFIEHKTFQIILVLHNALLLQSLFKEKDKINIISLTPGYEEKINEFFSS
jgi:ABC-type Mn2+/Zn2+ transport system ATPase subunit